MVQPCLRSRPSDANIFLGLKVGHTAVIMSDLDALRKEWTVLYSKTLPQLARTRSPAQPKWPVALDHCFARIILDNVVGHGEQQWDRVLLKPAVKNMSERQLRQAVELGRKISAGNVDLCELNEASLRCRGKNAGKHATAMPKVSKQTRPSIAPNDSRKRLFDKVDESGHPSTEKKRKAEHKQSTLELWRSQRSSQETNGAQPTQMKDAAQSKSSLRKEELEQILQRIQVHPSMTLYRKRLYTTLLSIPHGRYTTYAAISDYLKSSARAVGSGMRNNPFAPQVPCHRVLAADGSIGGFHGDWGKDGKYAAKKIELLRSEGVRFDGKKKVVGEPFRKFHSFEDLERSTLS